MVTIRIPKYRKRPDRDTAFVEIGGDRKPLPGKYDSPESWSAYHKLIREVSAAKAEKQKTPRFSLDFSVGQLVVEYLAWAKVYYLRQNGRRGSEYANIKDAIKQLLQLHGNTIAEDFGPLALAEVRAAMVATKLSRSTINARVHRIRRVFRWGASKEIVSGAVVQNLDTLAPLKKGKSAARESAPIAAVEPADVEALIPYLTPVQADMVTVHRLTGMRSENLCTMRWTDIDRSGEVWLYRPQHKTEHLGKVLTITLGPKCQAILKKYLERPAEEFFFSPRASEAQRRETQRKARKTPLTPFQASRQPKTNPKPKGRKGTRYTPGSYRRMIWYAIEKANVDREEKKLPPIPHWHPHQLRHTVGTEVRKKYNAESARVFLGHEHVKVTEIYAERDLGLAWQIALEMG